MTIENLASKRVDIAETVADIKPLDVLEVAKQDIKDAEDDGEKVDGIIVCYRCKNEDGEIGKWYLCGGAGIAPMHEAIGLLEYVKLKVANSAFND